MVVRCYTQHWRVSTHESHSVRIQPWIPGPQSCRDCLGTTCSTYTHSPTRVRRRSTMGAFDRIVNTVVVGASVAAVTTGAALC